MNKFGSLYGMELFVELGRTLSFSRASVNLGMSTPTFSRHILLIERDFGVKLFKRTTRSVSMTEAGLSYFKRCEHLVDEARVAHEALRNVATQPKGHLRISIPVDLGMYEIGPLFSEFLSQYPDISFDIDLSSRDANLAHDQVDFALQIGEVKQKSLFVRHIGSIAQGLFASPAYLQRHGQPVQPSDLAEHECIMFRGKKLEAVWPLQRHAEVVKVVVHGRFMLNSLGLMRVLAENGMGITALTTSLARGPLNEGTLERVLPEWTGPRLPIHACMLSHTQPAVMKVFLDFLIARLSTL